MEPSLYTFIGLVDIQALDQVKEANKWLYLTLQSRMKLNEKLFGVVWIHFL
jgi:hypothetical protein